MNVRKAHCLFEQSGTFKNEFIKCGIPAEDYDILNDFGETDHVVDLFAEIENAYEKKPSIFDAIDKDDVIVAFFPCTRFEAKIPLYFRGESHGQEKWNVERKIEYSMKLHEELHKLYMLICKLFLVAYAGGHRMIVENPATAPHYLTTYFPVRSSIIDKDRSASGDYYKKPTQYWFVNCEPETNITWEPVEDTPLWVIENTHNQVKRSLMHPQYARRFIKERILDGSASEPMYSEGEQYEFRAMETDCGI